MRVVRIIIFITRSLGALHDPTSSWRPFNPLGLLTDPRNGGDWIVRYPLDSVLAWGYPEHDRGKGQGQTYSRSKDFCDQDWPVA